MGERQRENTIVDVSERLAEPKQGSCCFSFLFCVEQQSGHGEDAKPILVASDRGGLLAAFDGMGGAGAATYTIGDTSRTGAYIAAHLARDVVHAFFLDEQTVASFPAIEADAQKLAELLRGRLADAFRAKAASFGNHSTPRLGGKLVRSLPTTLVSVFYERLDADIRFVTLSAGDSRAYLLTPLAGLQQVTSDDLKTRGDALENLRDDSPLSNCIDADAEFVLNVGMGSSALPVVFMVATDGCFNFVHTPAHFEWLILQSLLGAKSASDWSNQLQARLQEITGDDMSMAVAAEGWTNFAELVDSFRNRANDVQQKYVQPLDNLREEMEQLNQRAREVGARHDSLRSKLWSAYRRGYERFTGNQDQQK